MSMKIKKGDLVRVITGKSKGHEGKVLAVDLKANRVIVEGANMASKSTRANGQEKGGIIQKENFIHVSNVVLLYNGKPTRVGITRETVEKNGKKVVVRHRIAKQCGNAVID